MMQTIVLDDAGRLALIDAVIQQLEASGDLRAPDAIAEYQRQRAEVVARMASTSSATGDGGQAVASEADGCPPAQVVGMQTVMMRGQATPP